jgi:hypothetical protein
MPEQTGQNLESTALTARGGRLTDIVAIPGTVMHPGKTYRRQITLEFDVQEMP